jgi:hypothetical protein
LPSCYATFQCGCKNIFRKIKKKKNCPQNVEKNHPKKLHTYGSWEVFFLSAALTAQNSPELYFRFINYFIQSSLPESLVAPQQIGLLTPLPKFDIARLHQCQKYVKWCNVISDFFPSPSPFLFLLYIEPNYIIILVAIKYYIIYFLGCVRPKQSRVTKIYH